MMHRHMTDGKEQFELGGSGLLQKQQRIQSDMQRTVRGENMIHEREKRPGDTLEHHTKPTPTNSLKVTIHYLKPKQKY